MTFSADSSTVYITLERSNEVAFIDLGTQKVSAVHPVGKAPVGIWLTPDGKHLLVGLLGEDHVVVMDAKSGKIIKRITTAKGTHNFAAMGDKRRLLVSNRVANSISIIDMNTLALLETFPVTGGPDDMEVTADGKELWVTSRWAQKVTVVDLETRKVKLQIPVGRSPHGIYLRNHAPRE